MKYKLKYSQEAIAELNKAFTWYKSKDIDLDLGQRFKNTFSKICAELKENPKLFKELGTNYRRAVLGSSFPYTVYYSINEKTKTVKIIGVFHQSRDIELVNEKIKIQKIHQLQARKKQLEKIRERNELEKEKNKDLDIEL